MTKKQQPPSDWFRLDTAAKIYPAIAATHNNTTFRLVAELYEEVSKNLLQEALVRIMPRFPSFGVKLRRGMFWYYLEPNEEIPVVKKDRGFPCKRLSDLSDNGFLFHVSYFQRSVIFECFHGLADGAGAIEFLKTLIYEYFALCGYDMDRDGMVLDPAGIVPESELENSFVTYYDSEGDYNKLVQPQAYHIMGTQNQDSGIFVIHGETDLKAFLAKVKEKGVTVTAYVTALLICCIARQQGLEYTKSKKPVVISVPIDLRGIFPSTTLRNFMSFVNVGIVVKGKLELDAILPEVSRQIKEGMTKEAISANINKNVKYEKNPFIRMVPLFVKNIVVSNSYRNYGEGCYTMVLSNLRTATFPRSMQERIKNVYYSLGVSELNPLNCVLVSYRDKMVFTFSRGITETGVLQHFYRHLTDELGLELTLRGNEWGKR